MSVYLYKDKGLGDIMIESLRSNDIGRIMTYLNAGHPVHVVISSHNKFAAEWYEWIPGINVHVLPFNPDFAPTKAALVREIPAIADASALNMSVEPTPFEFPQFSCPENGVVVQPFAGTAGRCVFDDDLITRLDWPGVSFIGRADHRGGAYLEGDFAEVMPPVHYAEDYVNRLSVMETFHLVRRSRLFFGTYSCFWLIALYYGIDGACLAPRHHVERFVYGGSRHLHPQFSILDYPNPRRRYRVYVREDWENAAIVRSFAQQFQLGGTDALQT